jgi:hypothetical protein
MMTEFAQNFLALQCELQAPKNQFSDYGEFYYRSCEDILEAVKPLAQSKGILVTLSEQIIELNSRYYIQSTATARSIAEPDQQISATAFARETETKKKMDVSQITGAATSYARKYALGGLFLIDDVRDADSDNNSDHNKSLSTDNNTQPPQPQQTQEDAPISMAQAKRLFALAHQHGVSQEKIKEVIGVYGYTRTKEIKKQDYEKIVEEVTNAAQQQNT